MRSRFAGAVGVVLLAVGGGRAQPLPPPAAPPTPTPLPAPPGGTSLPPLLPVPSDGPLAEVPRPGPTPPGVEYDPNYLYLPEREPARAHPRRGAAECGPEGRWWFAPSLQLAWTPRAELPTTLRLGSGRLAALGGTPTGLFLPVAGRSTGRFDAALGLTVGHRFGEGNTDGVEASLFVRGSDTTFAGFAPGLLALYPQGTSRAPQFVPLPEPTALFVTSTFPTTLGTFFTTADVNYRHKLFCDDRSRLDVLVGYRFAYQQDELYLSEFHDGNDDYKRNRASVSNPFHGGQIGLAGEYRGESGWYVAGSAKVAFGVVTPEVRASGLFVGAEGRTGDLFRPLLALNASDESKFAVMPTLNLSVGRQVTARTRVFGGYSFQYLSRVARLNDALDPSANGLALTDFWVQSVNLGLEVRY